MTKKQIRKLVLLKVKEGKSQQEIFEEIKQQVRKRLELVANDFYLSILKHPYHLWNTYIQRSLFSFCHCFNVIWTYWYFTAAFH